MGRHAEFSSARIIKTPIESKNALDPWAYWELCRRNRVDHMEIGLLVVLCVLGSPRRIRFDMDILCCLSVEEPP